MYKFQLYHLVKINLSSVDLNLLVAFDILIREQNLSHAADKLGLTQLAMSKRPNRLRSLFGDELLVRTSKGMKPTARALELVEPIRIALKQIQVTIDGCTEFEPNYRRELCGSLRQISLPLALFPS